MRLEYKIEVKFLQICSTSVPNFQVDCTMFGFLSLMVCIGGFEGVFKKELQGDSNNIKPYVERMREKYWQDWDDLCKEAAAKQQQQ